MRLLVSVLMAVAPGHIVSAHGVRVVVPAGWSQVQSAGDGPVVDPRTVLVVGTDGVRSRVSQCQVASYHVPPGGAVVVVVAWRTATSGGGRLTPGRAPLLALKTVHRPSFECFAGRGAAAQVALGGKAYQVNVMVGNQASKQRIDAALAVARSFDLAR
jgi:hypothetical protein